MSREIKFRAWVGRMEYDLVVGKFVVFYVNPGAKGDGLDSKDAGSLTPFNTKYSDTPPVMQYTGLHDRNGKEIYEGDILKWIRQDEFYKTGDKKGKLKQKGAEFIAGEMIFIPDAEGWWVKDLNDKNWPKQKKDILDGYRPAGLNPSFGMADEYLEVIGNIYENPELLKGAV